MLGHAPFETSVRGGDVACRFGGRELVVIPPRARSKPRATASSSRRSLGKQDLGQWPPASERRRPCRSLWPGARCPDTVPGPRSGGAHTDAVVNVGGSKVVEDRGYEAPAILDGCGREGEASGRSIRVRQESGKLPEHRARTRSTQPEKSAGDPVSWTLKAARLMASRRQRARARRLARTRKSPERILACVKRRTTSPPLHTPDLQATLRPSHRHRRRICA